MFPPLENKPLRNRHRTLSGDFATPSNPDVRFPKNSHLKIRMNKTLELLPYALRGCWVFDDSRTGLKEEAFVLGMSEILTAVVALQQIPNAAKGFLMRFSDQPFEGAIASVSKIPGGGLEMGNWYRGQIGFQEMTGWLCPALYLYFAQAPEQIFMRAEPLPAGANPVWDPGGNDLVRRFVSAPEATTN